MKSFLHRHRGLIAINLLTLVGLVPFIDKPFHLDDPMYLWAALHVRAHPLDPYGFDVNWYSAWQPMARVMKNPPLTPYYLAAWSLAFGWGEVAMHAAMLLPALGLASGTYLLARRLCDHPFAAAAATMLAPATLISATTVMTDVTMMCFYVWSAYLWVRGIDQRRTSLLVAAAVLAAASALSKYFGVSLIPLLGAYALLRTRRLGSWALVLLAPVVLLAAYQQWTAALYGKGLLGDAAGYAAAMRWGRGSDQIAKVLTSLAFVGGCGATVVGVALAVRGRRAAVAMTVGAIVLLLVMVFFEPYARLTRSMPNGGAWLAAQVALFAAAGGVLLWQATRAWWRQRRDPDATLLALWIVGTLAFATIVNWSTNARAMLPLVPAAAILLLRRPALAARDEGEDADDEVQRPPGFRLACGIIVGGVIAVAGAVADYSLARSVVTAADAFAARASNDPGTRWFLGHWGFQWYMEQRGFTPVDAGGSVLSPGERIAVPVNNTNVLRLPADRFRTVDRLTFPTVGMVTTMNRQAGSGFYSDVWGPLPLAFGPSEPEQYRKDEVTVRMALHTK